MIISDKDIEKLSSSAKNRRAACRIDIEETLSELDITCKGELYHVEALLDSSYYENECMLEVDRIGHIIAHSCSCPFHFEEDACGHVIALAYYLQEHDFDIPCHIDVSAQRLMNLKKMKEELERKKRMALLEESTDWLRQTALPLIDLPLTKEKVHLYANVDQVSSYYGGTLFRLELKIGQKRSYVVKSIPQLLENIQERREVSYGKQLTFRHYPDAFDECCEKLLALLRQQSVLPRYNAMERFLIIHPQEADELYDALAQLPDAYRNVALKEARLKIHVRIQPSGSDAYRISLSEKSWDVLSRMMEGSKAMYELKPRTHVLVRYPLDEQKKIRSLLERMFERGELFISRQDFPLFYQTYLQELAEWIVCDQYPGNIELPETEDSIRLFLDMDSDSERIMLRLEYLYSGTVVPGFVKQEERSLSTTAVALEEYLRTLVLPLGKQESIAFLKEEYCEPESLQELGKGLSAYCDIFISDTLKHMTRPKQLRMQVGVRVHHSLLELTLSPEELNVSELADILRSYRRNKKFHKLKNGELLSLESRALQELNDLSEQLQLSEEQLQSQSVSVPSFRLFQLDQLSDTQQHIRYEEHKRVKQMKENFQKYHTHAFPLQPPYDTLLRDYQKDGYQWLKMLAHQNFGGLLADDMGLGKTLQIISFFDSERSSEPHLVISPASLLLNWMDEIHKFSPSLRCLPIYGSKAERSRLLEKSGEYDIVITSYDYLKRDINDYETKVFQTIVLDEAQYISNPKTKNAACVKKLKSKWRFALSGTPIENTLSELWSIFDFLMPGYLYSYSYFSKHYENEIIREEDTDTLNRLRRMVAPFILRRTKKEVLSELPDKTEHTMYFTFREQEQKLYQANLLQANKELREHLDIKKDGIKILALLTRLRQLCLEPRIVYENIREPSSKLEGCMELIRNMTASGKKILLFSSFTSVLDLIAQRLAQEGISHYMITGSVDKTQRKHYVDSFQQDDTPIFLISLKAGGTGLNLTAAECVIHFDPWWNQSAQSQATDRAYRIGQHNNVQVFNLIMKNSIEEKIQELQKKKAELADKLISSQDGSLMKEMDMAELLSLFS